MARYMRLKVVDEGHDNLDPYYVALHTVDQADPPTCEACGETVNDEVYLTTLPPDAWVELGMDAWYAPDYHVRCFEWDQQRVVAADLIEEVS